MPFLCMSKNQDNLSCLNSNLIPNWRNGMSAYGINECFIRQIASFAFILNMPDVCIDGFLDFVLKHDDCPCQADDGDDPSKSQP